LFIWNLTDPQPQAIRCHFLATVGMNMINTMADGFEFTDTLSFNHSHAHHLCAQEWIG